MNYTELYQQIKQKHSCLCVGLDTDMEKIPHHLLSLEDPIFEFNRAIIDATAPYCVSYKPNLAFYEQQGAKGWQSLVKTVDYIKDKYPEQFVIADAKRGDIGNTCHSYARAFFDTMNVDAVTVSPYMGEDSITPFLHHPNKWAVILALTSNASASDFELQELRNGDKLFEHVIKMTQQWGCEENIMYVVGATKVEWLKDIRKIAPYHFLLIPGVGAQGGSLEEVFEYGMNEKCGLLINVSRSIIYASNDETFAIQAQQEAQKIQSKMKRLLVSLR